MRSFFILLVITIVAPLSAQKTFTYDFRHGEGDKFYGRLHYQLSLEQAGTTLGLDSKEVRLIPESASEEIKVTLLVTEVDLAYKKASFESKSQDREVEVFYVQFEPIPNPSYGMVDYLSVPKIFDPKARAGATSTKAVLRFVCSNSEPVQSSINLSWKVYFSPRGKNSVMDSRDFNIMIPVQIEAPAELYINQVRITKALEFYSRLLPNIKADPDRRNDKIKNALEVYLKEYGDLKRPEIKEFAAYLKQYENRKEGPADVYQKIKRFQRERLMPSASSAINNYVENCVQGIWAPCPHLEEVRYLQIVHGKADTVLINGFMSVYPSSQYNGELYGLLLESRSRGRGRSSSSVGSGGSGGSRSAGPSGESTTNIDVDAEQFLDSIRIEQEPAGVNIDYNEAQRRIIITKTGDWEDYNYFYEMIGIKGRQGKRAVKVSKQEILYIEDFDNPNDAYEFHVYKRKGQGKYELLNDEVSFVIERAAFNTRWILYGFLGLVLGLGYYLYSRFIKI